ncbi:MAG: hypothetical protein ABSB60_00170 [Terracidiphilus sp.]|jgi:hypothetical protein
MGSAASRICELAGLLTWLATPCLGQTQQPETVWGNDASISSGELPDTPRMASDKTTSNLVFGVLPPTTTGRPAKKFHLVVQTGEFGVPLSGIDKLELSLRSRLTVSDLASTLFSAGWSQMRDSAPHFGADSGAFGERLGALALKQTTQSVFNYGIYATIFQDDPRYYVMGRQRSIAARAAYSASRLIITRKDDGRAAINWPKLAGIGSASALTNTYYPARDHGFANNASAFGVSLGTTILTNEIHEFLGDGLRMLRRDRN